jgi:hypothetical protein
MGVTKKNTLEIGEPKNIEIFVKYCYKTGGEISTKECVECEWHIWSVGFGSQCSLPEGETKWMKK